MKFIYRSIVSCTLFLVSYSCSAQGDSTYHIGLILPFQTNRSLEKMEAYSNAHDFFTASRISLSEDEQTALDFYEGTLQSLNELEGGMKIELHVYDNYDNDSITQEILKDEELKELDVIIGSVSSSSAKLVADFCKQNKIINIQPFTPSKSLTSENPYHLKLAPTIDAHVSAMFNSIVDSFAGSNIIIYTPNSEKSVSAATQLDSLFRDYNTTASQKFTVALLNTKDMMLNGKKTTAKEQLKTNKSNILILTSYEESFVNGNLRVLHEARDEYPIVVYGMPTWLKSEILRLDYLNDFNTRVTDPFFIDSAKEETKDFIMNFEDNFSTQPQRYAYLGYDVMNFTLSSLRDYGTDFINYISTQRYSGTAYKFDITKAVKNNTTVNYLENRYVHVFKVQDYQLKKVW